MRSTRGVVFAVAVALALVADAARAEGVSDELSKFVATFWSPKAGQFYRFSDHHALAGKGAYADYWWQAQMWETVIDHYRLTRDAKARKLVKDIEAGFKRSHPHWRLPGPGFWIHNKKNLYNDDLGWWAVACIHAYEATGDRAYLHDARDLYGTIVKSQVSDGSVTWRHTSGNDGPDRTSEYNVATNSLFVQLAAGLSRHDTNAKRRADCQARALRCYAWLERHLVSGDTVWDGLDAHGKLHRWQLSYDYGGVIAANVALHETLHQGPYLDRATALARAAIEKVRTGKLRDEDRGVDGNGTGFFDIFTRDLVPLAGTYALTDVRQFLGQNAARFAAQALPGRVYRASSVVDARQQAQLAAHP